MASEELFSVRWLMVLGFSSWGWIIKFIDWGRIIIPIKLILVYWNQLLSLSHASVLDSSIIIDDNNYALNYKSSTSTVIRRNSLFIITMICTENKFKLTPIQVKHRLTTIIDNRLQNVIAQLDKNKNAILVLN